MDAERDTFQPIDMAEIYKKHNSLKKVEAVINPRLKERDAILSLIPTASVGAEIGVFTGMLSEYLLDKVKPTKLYLVDPWSKLHGERFPNFGAYSDHGKLQTAAALNAVRFRVKRFPAAEIVQEFSQKWLAEQPDHSLDWVYLDASHKYENTMNELQAIEPKLKPDGMILGDDAWTKRGGRHYGVFRAITDFCKQRPFELFRLDQYAQWAIRPIENLQPQPRSVVRVVSTSRP